MAFIRVSILTIAFLFTQISIGVCQSKDQQPVDILGNIHTVENEKYTANNKNNDVFILVTSKNCSYCFDKLCEYFNSSKYKNYTVHVISFIKFDLLSLDPMSVECKHLVPCASDVLFYFTNQNAFSEVYNMPSPQLIIKERNKFKYYDYSSTNKLYEQK